MEYKNAKPLGELVLLKKLVKTLDKKYGDIFIPQSVSKNASLGVAQVIDLGNKAKELGINVNDYVLYDYYSVFENNPEYVLTKVENIILKITDSEKDNYINNCVIK